MMANRLATLRRGLVSCLVLSLSRVLLGESVALEEAWGEWDPLEIHELSAESTAGFTSNHLDVVPQPEDPKNPEFDVALARPKIFQAFEAIEFEEPGSTVTLSFDVLLHEQPLDRNSFRFGLADTSTNSGFSAQIRLRRSSGTTMRMRYDDDITSVPAGGESEFVPGRWDDWGLTCGCSQQAAGSPNGVALEAGRRHTFALTLTRVDVGFTFRLEWSNDGGDAVLVFEDTFDYESHHLDVFPGDYREMPDINTIDGVGFMINLGAPFSPRTTGSYTVSDLSITHGEDACPPSSDTRCTGLDVSPTDTGALLVEASGEDDSGDTPLFTFLARGPAGTAIGPIGPQEESSVTLDVTPGVWTVNVFVDDDPDCDDEDESNSCETKIAIDTARPRFVRGDGNGDGSADLSDAVHTLNFLFTGGAPPGCESAANANGDRAVDIADPTYLLNHLFLGGPEPLPPFPDCGTSDLEAEETLGCDASSCP